MICCLFRSVLWSARLSEFMFVVFSPLFSWKNLHRFSSRFFDFPLFCFASLRRSVTLPRTRMFAVFLSIVQKKIERRMNKRLLDSNIAVWYHRQRSSRFVWFDGIGLISFPRLSHDLIMFNWFLMIIVMWLISHILLFLSQRENIENIKNKRLQRDDGKETCFLFLIYAVFLTLGIIFIWDLRGMFNKINSQDWKKSLNVGDNKRSKNLMLTFVYAAWKVWNIGEAKLNLKKID